MKGQEEQQGRGSKEGEFDGPEAVVVSDNGEVFVSDTGKHRIQVFV